MNEPTTEQLLDTVTTATTATDLFGPADGPARSAKRTFRIYAARLHPDRAADAGIDIGTATDAFERLNRFYTEWNAAASGTGTATDIVVAGQRSTYTAAGDSSNGTVAVVYDGTATDGTPVAIKIPRKASSNTYLLRECTALTRLAVFTAQPTNAWLSHYYPQLIDLAMIADPDHGGHDRQVNVLNALGATQGFVDLGTVATAFPDGLDGRDWAWIHRRLLRAVAGAHRLGIVHGAIVPENVLIHPDGHGVVLAGWSMACDSGQPLPGRIASHVDLYPPNPDETATPAMDVYMTHSLMANVLAPSERRQLAFARGCMQPAPGMRPDAAELLDEYDELLEDLYGRRRFRRFPYTVSVA